MITDFQQIRASLVPATIADVFDGTIRRANTFFACFDPVKQIFNGTFTVAPEEPDTTESKLRDALNRFHDDQALQRVLQGRLYKLTSFAEDASFTFQLVLRRADEDDLMCGMLWGLKPNAIFYGRRGESISGPFTISAQTGLQAMRSAIDDGLIYVPHHKQIYKEILIQKSG